MILTRVNFLGTTLNLNTKNVILLKEIGVRDINRFNHPSIAFQPSIYVNQFGRFFIEKRVHCGQLRVYTSSTTPVSIENVEVADEGSDVLYLIDPKSHFSRLDAYI